MMRTVLVVIVGCALGVRTVPVHAQARAGLHAGLSRSALIMDSGDTGFRPGLIGGGWVRFPIVRAAGLQLGAYYTEKGSSDTVADVTAAVELKYYEFPVLLAFMLNRYDAISGYVAAGGTFALQRECRLVLRGAGVSGSVSCEATIASDGPAFFPEDLDVGFTVGGGVEFDRGLIILTLDLRANLGLFNALSVSVPSSEFNFDDDQGQNLHLGLLAGIAFPLSPRPVR